MVTLLQVLLMDWFRVATRPPQQSSSGHISNGSLITRDALAIEASGGSTAELWRCHQGRSRTVDKPNRHRYHRRTPPTINQIPPELLGEIFMHHLQTTRNPPNGGPRLTFSASSLSSPILLGQVCGHWRNISLSMPTLWSSVAIHRPQMYHIPMVRLWLERAANCPLSLYIAQPGRVDGEATHEVLEVFISRIHRWKRIQFYFTQGPFPPLLDLTEGSVQMVESATLYLDGWDPASVDKIWRVIHASPALRQARWLASYPHGLPAHVPWAQLTHIIHA